VIFRNIIKYVKKRNLLPTEQLIDILKEISSETSLEGCMEWIEKFIPSIQTKFKWMYQVDLIYIHIL